MPEITQRAVAEAGCNLAQIHKTQPLVGTEVGVEEEPESVKWLEKDQPGRCERRQRHRRRRTQLNAGESLALHVQGESPAYPAVAVPGTCMLPAGPIPTPG